MRYLFIASCLLITGLLADFKPTRLPYTFRPKNKPISKLKKYDKLMILAPIRNGSTLVYMVAQYLFENTFPETCSANFLPGQIVYKSDSVQVASDMLEKYRKKIYFIVPLRNPIKALASYIRVIPPIIAPNPEHIKHRLSALINHYNQIIQFLEGISDRSYITLRFEKFVNSIDYITKGICKPLWVRVPHSERLKIINFFSKDNLIKIQSQLDSFENYDVVTHLHGNHIANHPIDISPYLTQQILGKELHSELVTLLKRLGYNYEFLEK